MNALAPALEDRNRLLLALLVVNLAALIVSGWRPYDRVTWLLEVLPTLVALPVLVLTRRTYPLSTLLYVLITLHACVLAGGGAYTYARVPLGFWVQEAFGLTRNPYDKLGHFMQGFVPALIAREILLRGGYVRGRKMLAFICICIPLAISAFYELIEWWTALALGQGVDDEGAVAYTFGCGEPLGRATENRRSFEFDACAQGKKIVRQNTVCRRFIFIVRNIYQRI